MLHFKFFTTKKISGLDKSGYSQATKQWFGLLLLCTILLIGGIIFSLYRFNYWSNLESTISKEDYSSTEYDRNKADKIIEEFEARESVLQQLLSNTVLTTTATTTQTATSTEEQAE